MGVWKTAPAEVRKTRVMKRVGLLVLVMAMPCWADPQCLRHCAELISELDKECRAEKDPEGKQACLKMKDELKRECESDCRKKK